MEPYFKVLPGCLHGYSGYSPPQVPQCNNPFLHSPPFIALLGIPTVIAMLYSSPHGSAVVAPHCYNHSLTL